MPAENSSQLDLFSSSQPQLTRHFLGWHRPLLELATEHLAAEWKEGPLDLSSLIIVVPTRNASRRLRESLAILASQRKSGVLPPHILNPDDLLVPNSENLPVASKAESLTAWLEVLLTIDLTSYPHLFPVVPVAQNFSWALATAKDFLSVQSLLGEGAHNINYAAKVLATQDLEPERWEELAQLERDTFSKLEKMGRQPRSAARRQAIETWNPPSTPSYQKLILLGLPDPPPALQPLIERLSHTIPVEVIIHAPQEESAHFDSLGQPQETWNGRPLATSEEQIHQCSSPASQADKACSLLQNHEQPHLVAAIGIPDPEVIAPLQKSLTRQDWLGFDPSGESLQQQGISHLLHTLSEFANSQLLLTFRDLLRIPGVAEAAGSFQVPAEQNPFSANRILEAFDRFHEKHLCESLSDARTLFDRLESDRAPIIRSLQWISHHLERIKKKNLSEALSSFLNEIYQHLPFDKDDRFPHIAQTLNETIAEIEALPLTKQSGLERFQLFLSLLDEQIIASKRREKAIDLPGWLEIPWEDAPHIILTGCNDGLVPESIQSHPWLPNQARQLLSLRHNLSRQARDTYLMASLIASRHQEGRLDLLFGRVNSQNDPLRPSRLLLALPPEKLPQRVDDLFAETQTDTIPLPWKLAWQLTPPKPDPNRFQRLSVTSFSSYLDCPFRYYLQFGLKMRSPDLDRMELNARDFGTLTHDVLEDFAKTETAHSESETEIRECFQDLLSIKIEQTYGQKLSAPLLIQENSIRQRLNWWAEHEAHQRREGWTILETETKLAPEETPFCLDEMIISGFIDRIEQHPHQGLRILDFKTKKKPNPVTKAHLRAPKRSENPQGFPSWRLTELNGKAMCWTNLQIPLYLLALSTRFPSQNCLSGYVQLGATKGDVYLDLWHDLDDNLLESARQCALGVIENIRQQVFWPPAQSPAFDDFAPLLFGDPLTAIDPINLLPPSHA